MQANREDVMTQCANLRKQGFRPYRIAQLTDGQRVEIMSYPFCNEEDQIAVMARTTPGDPTTMLEYKVCDLQLQNS